LAGGADAFLKFSAAVSLLLAASSVGYYFAVYLPARDAKLDSDRRVERAHADLARQAEEERTRSEKEATELRAAAGREAAKLNYQECLRFARSTYDNNWALNCKATSDKNRKGRADCLATATSKDLVGGCERIWPQVDPTNCSLPRPLSSEINSDYDKARDRCLKESNAGLQ
jgi:hypothetical protein